MCAILIPAILGIGALALLGGGGMGCADECAPACAPACAPQGVTTSGNYEITVPQQAGYGYAAQAPQQQYAAGYARPAQAPMYGQPNQMQGQNGQMGVGAEAGGMGMGAAVSY